MSRLRRRLAWLGVLALLPVAAVVFVVAWASRPAIRPADSLGRPALAALERKPEGEARPVRGNPGWETLGEEERRRARQPLTDDARGWLVENGPAVRAVATAFDVSPVALGGIVAAEKTLLVGRVDAIGDELFQAVFGTLRERDLERWIRDQEAKFRRAAAEGQRPETSLVKNPYLWTLGPAQVSFRLATQYEPAIARRLGRPERGVGEVLEAVTSVPGNLEYAAALLAEARFAYHEIAGMDIADNPGVLATLYHLGAPTVRARRLAADNAARVARGRPAELPQVNFYGAFVNLHAEEIAALLDG